MASEENFDLSALSYDDFLLYFLTHPANDELWQLDDKGQEYSLAEETKPEIIVRYLTRFCDGFARTAVTITPETLDHAIKGMLNPACYVLQASLWDDAVPLALRLECIRSMYSVYANFVAVSTARPVEGAFYMWWDFVCSDFWSSQTRDKKIASEDYRLLSQSDRELADCMFETLKKILALDDDACRGCALHGLGHLKHPGVHAIVQSFIDEHRATLTPDGLKWLESCRDGTVM